MFWLRAAFFITVCSVTTFAPVAEETHAEVPLRKETTAAPAERLGRETAAFEPPASVPIELAPATDARPEPIPAQTWSSVEAEVRWFESLEREPFKLADWTAERNVAALARTKTEAELLAELKVARPLFSEYPELLGALYLQDPVRGRARILEHLKARPENPEEGLRAWSPAMSSLRWWKRQPFDEELLDAIACVIATDPGSWFYYGYLTESAKRRRQPNDVAEVVRRLPPAEAKTLQHYAWMMEQSASDISADLRSMGVPFEGLIGPELRVHVDAIDFWTPMERLRRGFEVFPSLWWSNFAEPGDLTTKYDYLWRAATALAPRTLRGVRLGLLRATDDRPLKLVLDVRGKRWWVAISSEHTDEAAATALIDRAVASREPARFHVINVVRGDHFGLVFGTLDGIKRMVARYRLDEPDFNLLTPRTPVDPNACPLPKAPER